MARLSPVKAMSNHAFCDAVLRSTKARSTSGFTGLGVIFYSNLESLPHTSLGDLSTPRPRLPVSGIDAIAEVLARVAEVQSPWHDGFHLVDVAQEKLTHLSQFLSPDLGRASELSAMHRPFGARQMASLLTSKLAGIARVGLITPSGEMSYFAMGVHHMLRSDA